MQSLSSGGKVGAIVKLFAKNGMMPSKTLKIVLLVYCSLSATTQPCIATSTDQKALELINILGCKACHEIAGEGGNLAAKLDDIGSRMTRAQISAHLAAHTEPSKKAFMPSYNTSSKDELDLLSEFLYNLQ